MRLLVKSRTLAALAFIVGLSSSTVALAQPETKIYGAKPPAGSSYVRIVDASTSAANVVVGTASAVTLKPSGPIATTYRIVADGKSPNVSIDGKPVSAGTVPPDKFVTLVYRLGAGGPQLTAISDDPGEDNGLLAQLRFYNLVEGCDASLSLQSGPTVFEGVAADSSRSRSINPVTATLVPKCGTTAGTPLKLPPLKAGDHYSIFLIGSPTGPRAVGNSDATEVYKG